MLVFRKDEGETPQETEKMRIRRLVAGSCKLNDPKQEKAGSIELNIVKQEGGATQFFSIDNAKSNLTAGNEVKI